VPASELGPVVLVGMMATGKTTVSRRLASKLGRTVFDSDRMIEDQTGHTVAELWERDGEAAYRALETAVLETAVAAVPPGIVAAAGGVVLSAANRALLAGVSAGGGVVVWLRADPAVLAGRVHPGDHRPLLASDPAGALRKMAVEREGLYASVADVSVDATAPVDDVVLAVLEAVGA
jgi:shikimate kinase